MYLILKTHASGLFDHGQTDEQKPHMASIALIAIDDQSLEERSVYTALVKPSGWLMSPGATAVNGLTDEYLAEHGAPLGEVMAEWIERIATRPIVVGWSMPFEYRVIRLELRRLGLDDWVPWYIDLQPLARKLGVPAGEFRRSPSLADSAAFYGASLGGGTRTALADARAIQIVFLQMLSRGITMPPPQVP